MIVKRNVICIYDTSCDIPTVIRIIHIPESVIGI